MNNTATRTPTFHRLTIDPGGGDPAVCQVILSEDPEVIETHARIWGDKSSIRISRDRAEVVIVDVPVRFYDDHVSRALRAGMVLKRLSKKTRVALDAESYDELLSDARHYADPSMGYAAEDSGLFNSARATVRNLEAVERPAEAPHWKTEVGQHALVLRAGESVPNPTRTGHRLYGPAAFVYRVWEDGGLDITSVDLDDPRLDGLAR